MNTTRRDGKIYKYYKPQSYLCSSSKDFISEVYNAILLNNFEPNFQHVKCAGKSNFLEKENRHIKYTSDMYKVRFSTKRCHKFLKWIYYEGHCMSNPRKYKKALEIINFYKDK